MLQTKLRALFRHVHVSTQAIISLWLVTEILARATITVGRRDHPDDLSLAMRTSGLHVYPPHLASSPLWRISKTRREIRNSA